MQIVAECGLPILIQNIIPRFSLSPLQYIVFVVNIPENEKEIFIILEIVRIQKVLRFYWSTLLILVLCVPFLSV